MHVPTGSYVDTRNSGRGDIDFITTVFGRKVEKTIILAQTRVPRH